MHPSKAMLLCLLKTAVEMPGIEPGAFHMQSERSTAELHPLAAKTCRSIAVSRCIAKSLARHHQAWHFSKDKLACIDKSTAPEPISRIFGHKKPLWKPLSHTLPTQPAWEQPSKSYCTTVKFLADPQNQFEKNQMPGPLADKLCCTHSDYKRKGGLKENLN